MPERLPRPLICLSILAFVVAAVPASTKAQAARPITVADTIAMTQLIDHGPGLHDFMVLSPDGLHFCVVTERGDITANERIFSLLVFRTSEVFQRPADIVANFSSSTDDDGIADVRWLDNNDVTFLGTDKTNPSQVYVLDIRTSALRKLTASSTKINAYAVAAGLDRVLYTADADLSAENDYLRRHGFTVSDQSLTDLLMGNLDPGRLHWRDLDYEVPQDTFIKDLGSGRVMRVGRTDLMVVVPNALFPYSRNPISPNGRFAVIQGLARGRDDWRASKSPYPSMVAGESGIPTFVLVDLASGLASPLIDAPSSPYLLSASWAPDSRSVVVVNTFLPITGNAGRSTQTQTAIAEVDLARRSTIVLHGPALDGSAAQGVVCAQAIDWSTQNGLLLAISKSPDNRGGVCKADEAVRYEKNVSGWHEITTSTIESALRSSPDGRITISVDQGLNTPPNLKATDHITGRRQVFTDFNPQFRNLRFAPVTLINWNAPDGTIWSGDLYMPPDAQPNRRRYPLVIQTHGCTVDKFSMTGFDSTGATGYAAQVLANKDIVILQEGHCTKQEENSPAVRWPYYSAENAEHELLGYESAIDLLDQRGIIDRDHVGLEGHSATAWMAVYAAAHPKSNYHYAAVLSTARGDLGYFAYLATSYGRFWSLERNGAPPVGKDLETFWRNALPANLEQVNTPIMSQEPDGLRYLPLMWEIHEVLSLLGKPDELVVFPDGIHNLVKPWERFTSQQAAVDWFCFWLEGDEDPDPAKRDQYRRWRAWRDQENQARARQSLPERLPMACKLTN